MSPSAVQNMARHNRPLPLHIFCSLARFLFSCTFFVPLNNFCSIWNIFYSCFQTKKSNNKASFRTFESCLGLLSKIWQKFGFCRFCAPPCASLALLYLKRQSENFIKAKMLLRGYDHSEIMQLFSFQIQVVESMRRNFSATWWLIMMIWKGQLKMKVNHWCLPLE